MLQTVSPRERMERLLALLRLGSGYAIRQGILADMPACWEVKCLLSVPLGSWKLGYAECYALRDDISVIVHARRHIPFILLTVDCSEFVARVNIVPREDAVPIGAPTDEFVKKIVFHTGGYAIGIYNDRYA